MRKWIRVIALWGPFWTLWAVFSLVYPGETLTSAAVGATAAIGAAGLLGLGAWWFTGVYHWPPPEQLGFKFYGIQLAMGSTFSLAWLFALVGTDALRQHKDLIVALRDWSRVLGWYFVLGLAIYGLVTGISYTVRTRGRLQDQERLAAEARLAALRNQLNPHFLFNALHSLSVLVRRDQNAAQIAIEQLGDILRYTLAETEADEVQLSEEWRFTKTYLALEQIRFGERLSVEELLSEDTLACLVPSFTLQVLAENAVRHGIGPLPGGGVVRFRSYVENGNLILEVSDTGAGMVSGEKAIRGHGLTLLRERLATLYREEGTLQTDSIPGQGFTAWVRLPVRRE
jgi:two-component system, LytTR family, sensor kinase